MIFKVLTPSLYGNYTMEDYPTEQDDYPHPGDAPDFSTATNSNDQKRLQLEFDAACKKHYDCKNMDQALVRRALACLESKYVDKWDRYCTDNGIGQPTYLQLLNWLIDNYGECDAVDRDNNETRMKAQWDGSDFQDLVDQINDGQEFATYAGHQYTDAKLVDMAEINIIKSGQYGDIHEDWLKDSITNGRTWENLKTFWESALRIRKKSSTTAGTLGYGMNAEEVAAERDLQKSIHNYGEIQRQQTETMKNMSNTETGLAALDTKVNMLTQQLQMMCQLTGQAAAAPPPMYQQQQQYYQPIQQQAYQPR